MRWPGVLRSLTVRLTLIYLLLFGGSIGLMIAVSYVGGVWQPLRTVEATVRRQSDALAKTYRTEGRDALLRALERRVAGSRGRLPYHVLVAPNGAVVAANLAEWPATRGPEWLRYEFGTYATGTEEEHEAVVRDIRFPDGYRLLVGLDTEDLDEREDLITEGLAWGAGMSLILGIVGGLMITYVVSQRLESINRAARAVIGGDLSGRVRLRGSGDDFDQLSATLNEMLARIEGLVASISRVSDSIAHELRTPLARLRAELEDLAAGDATPDEVATRAAAALDEASRLQAMFEGLLRIARLRSDPKASMASLDVSALAEDAADWLRPAADEKSQSLTAEIEPGLRVQGERDLIFQMVSNLLDNAVKFTPEGGGIRLAVRRRGGRVVIEVRDTGPGIPAADRERVLERFYRAAGSDTSGFGLGLSLVAAAAERHGADLRLCDAAPGLKVTVEFGGASG